jgi:hypothetical protein
MQAVPGSVIRVFKSVVEELTEVLDPDSVDVDASQHLASAPPERVAAVCVQFFLRMAVKPPESSADSGGAGPENGLGSGNSESGETGPGNGVQGPQLLAGKAVPGRHTPAIARLPRLVPCCLSLVQVRSVSR